MKTVLTFLKEKLTSRKFWTLIAGIVLGAATIFGLDQSDISTIAGSVTIIFSVLSYMITEGKIDVERIKTIAIEVNKITEVVDNSEEEIIEEDIEPTEIVNGEITDEVPETNQE